MKKHLSLLVFAATLTACASGPEAIPTVRQLDYRGLGRITLATQDIRVINRSGAVPQTKPHLGDRFKPTLADAVNRWVADRLVAVGSTGHATLILKDANVTESRIPNSETGIASWFTRYQGMKYTGRIEMVLDTQGLDGSAAQATISAVHSVTVPEAPSEQEKYDAHTKLVDALMRDLNASAEKGIHAHMGKFLVAVGAPTSANDDVPMVVAPSPKAAPLMVVPSSVHATKPAPESVPVVTAPAKIESAKVDAPAAPSPVPAPSEATDSVKKPSLATAPVATDSPISVVPTKK